MRFCKNLGIGLGKDVGYYVHIGSVSSALHFVLLRAAIIGRRKQLTCKFLVINNRIESQVVRLYAYAEYGGDGRGVSSGVVSVWAVDKEYVYVGDHGQ